MWGGVTSGFAGVKFSGSPKRLGEKRDRAVNVVSRKTKPRRSLYVK